VLAFSRRDTKENWSKNKMSNLKKERTNVNIDTSLETNKNRLVTEKIAAAIIGVSYETLKRSIRWQKRIPYYKMNKRISYRISDLEEFIQKCKIPAQN
jgi:hypothetical protein